MTQAALRTLRIGHSPDPDDAFMWYPLLDPPRVDTGPYRFEHVLEDIQSLNKRAEARELEITAISIAQYPHVAKDYVLTNCGASMGDGYGPMVVARHPMNLRDLIVPLTLKNGAHDAPSLAIPGDRTSAWLALQLRLMEEGAKATKDFNVNASVVPFDQIIEQVASGEFDAGLIIHEGQLTYGRSGLVCVEDLGRWWQATRGGPLPLGGNAIRRDLDDGEIGRITAILKASIEYALAHRDEAVAAAMKYARDMGRDLADRFVGMYVNDWTLDYGDAGRDSVRRFLREAADAELVPDPGDIDFAHPA